MKTAALIMAAGQGTRTGQSLPKQFALLGGKPVLAHSVDSFAAHPAIDSIHVVTGENQHDMAATALAGCKIDGIVTGGAERKDSVRAGLEMINADRVLIHDAARPLLPAAVIDRLIAALDTHDGAVPVLPIADTLAETGANLGQTVDRNTLVRVQTPQAFRFDAIMTSHRRWTGGMATDDAQMARAAGFAVAMVEGDAMLEKITQAADFALAEARLATGLIPRTGMGYDVHRLVTGAELWLCGIRIDHDRGLAGHSDADVALHAVTDALLGAIGDGDIGTHFPPSDARWKGAASSQFVEHARDLIAARGGVIDHVDLTIICEAPKIGPHRTAMQARLSALLRVDTARISIKATTTEGLGFTGRGEGIAAQAVANVRL